MISTSRLCLAAALFTVAANAGTITSVGVFTLPGFSTGSLGPVGATPAPNNDNTDAPSPNVIPYSIFFNSPGFMEASFNTASSGGTTEYRFTQSFINNSHRIWSGFRFELGFGTGANFVRSSATDLLDFDTPDRDPAASSLRFSSVNHGSDVMVWSGGTVPSIGVTTFAFAIDVPDGIGTFTLRQTPSEVPEPASMALVCAGMVSIAGAALRRRRSRQG